MNKAIRLITMIAWGVLGVVRGMLFAVPTAPGWLQIILWIASLSALLWLLVVYNRRMAQWRVVLGFWIAYSGLRWLATRLPMASSVPLLHDHLATLVTVLVMDTLIAGYAALFLLAIRRDVSVAYVIFASFFGGIALRGQIQASGSVLNWLFGMTNVQMQEGFNLIEPLTLAGSCMITLGLLTFLPHLIWLGIREARGHST